MPRSLLTERQKEILRYRKRGMTQQQVADIIHTSKPNVCLIEKMALRKIRQAEATLVYLKRLDARLICTLEAGSDLFDTIPLIVGEARKAGIHLPDNPIDLINRIRLENPGRIHGRYIRENIDLFLQTDGELHSGGSG